MRLEFNFLYFSLGYRIQFDDIANFLQYNLKLAFVFWSLNGAALETQHLECIFLMN